MAAAAPVLHFLSSKLIATLPSIGKQLAGKLVGAGIEQHILHVEDPSKDIKDSIDKLSKQLDDAAKDVAENAKIIKLAADLDKIILPVRIPASTWLEDLYKPVSCTCSNVKIE